MGGTTPAPRTTTMESIPYTLPLVSREETRCPICHKVFVTGYQMHQHMDIHKGSGYPCSKYHKSLVMRKTLAQHEKACKEGIRHLCEACDKLYASAQILKQHVKVTHGLRWMRFLSVLTAKRHTVSKRACGSMLGGVLRIPTGKGHISAGWRAAPRLTMLFNA